MVYVMKSILFVFLYLPNILLNISMLLILQNKILAFCKNKLTYEGLRLT
jgi:hypothetical protein